MYMTPQVRREKGEAEAVVALHRRLQLQAEAVGRGTGRRGRADRDGAAAQRKHSVILLTKCERVHAYLSPSLFCGNCTKSVTCQVRREEGEAEAVVAVHRRLHLQAVAAERGTGRSGRGDRDGAAA